jgi:FMN phosphatase YigB (HAD superfamily)
LFAAIVGGDAVPAKKPDSGHLRAVLERLGTRLAQSVMVGDSERDVHAARGLGVPCVLVSFGYPGAGAPPRSRSGDRLFRRAPGRARAPRRGGGVMPRKIGAPRGPLTPSEAGS